MAKRTLGGYGSQPTGSGQPQGGPPGTPPRPPVSGAPSPIPPVGFPAQLDVAGAPISPLNALLYQGKKRQLGGL